MQWRTMPCRKYNYYNNVQFNKPTYEYNNTDCVVGLCNNVTLKRYNLCVNTYFAKYIITIVLDTETCAVTCLVPTTLASYN